MKLTERQKIVLQALRMYYSSKFAEDPIDGSNFDCAILDLLDNDIVEKQMNSSSYRFSRMLGAKKHEHTFEPDTVPGWKVCSSCRLTVRE